MWLVVVPILILFIIILVKPIPLIGGSVEAALGISAVTMALMAHMSAPELFLAAIDGLDRMAWVIALSFFGALYAETQIRLGAVDTVMDILRKIFGNSSRGLIIATFITLVIGGSLLGDAIAAATVIGMLVVHTLAANGLKPTQIGMIILVGASLGSLMPPVSQAIMIAASLVDTTVTPLIRISFITVGSALVFAIIESMRFVRRKKGTNKEKQAESLPALPPLFTILKTRGYTLIPMTVLLTLVILNAGWGINLFSFIPGLNQAIVALGSVAILKGLANFVVLAIITASLIALCFPAVRSKTWTVVREGSKKVLLTVRLQVFAGLLIGIVYASGAIDIVGEATSHLQGNAIILGGVAGLIMIGMLVGSQTAAQTIIVPFFAPLLAAQGVDSFNIALGVSHIAGAGQNFPPVGLTAFVVSGMVGGALGKKVDPVKVMLLSLPNSLYLVAIGVIALYI